MLGELGLWLSPEKTRIVELTRGKEGFDFLGFHLRKVESWKWRGKWYLQRWPSARAMNRIRAKIRALTDRRYSGLPIDAVVDRLNPVLRGWGNYFRDGNSARKFAQIDSYVHERLAILACNKHQLSGRKWVSRFNGDMARAGLVFTPFTERAATGLRMPRDEGCRRAVCGRTACTDRCGGGRRQAASRQARAAR